MTANAAQHYVIMIPARLGSTRLANKVMLKVADAPLLIHTWRAANASAAARVVIAADDSLIADTAADFGAEVVVTGPAASGTDRLGLCAQQLQLPDDTIVVNLQADEPLMPAQVLDSLAKELFTNPDAAMATACCPISDDLELMNPNAVKVVLDGADNALYFSRAPIPFERGRHDQQPPAASLTGHLRHLGVYAYRAGFLKQFSGLEPPESEGAESLEQLRALHHGFRIRVIRLTEATPPGIDTHEDWEKFSQYINSL